MDRLGRFPFGKNMLLRVLNPVRWHSAMAHIITAVKGADIDRCASDDGVVL